MTKLAKPIVILCVLIALAANAYFYISKSIMPAKPKLTPAQTALITIGAKCLDFGERSVANDNPIIEFQMVVRLAKKTTTINNCMTDNGYKQNAAWVKYAQPIANAEATKNKISESEAITNLSRVDMQIFEPQIRPDYWVKQ